MYATNDERFDCCVERAAEINADPPYENNTDFIAESCVTVHLNPGRI